MFKMKVLIFSAVAEVRFSGPKCWNAEMFRVLYVALGYFTETL